MGSRVGCIIFFDMILNTFSICARCEKTKQIGIAVSTAVPNVGSLCPYIKPGVGAIVTQSLYSKDLGINGLRLLSENKSVEDVTSILLEKDSLKELRQLAVLDASGNSYVWTGRGCFDWAGHFYEKNIAIQGNFLASESVIQEMRNTFEEFSTLPLEERLMLSLESGREIGGDKRNNEKRSAALIVSLEDSSGLMSLMIDNASNPIEKLRSVFDNNCVQRKK
jgi:uncharacterized Ntn-hydrolase superfamily protein